MNRRGFSLLVACGHTKASSLASPPPRRSQEKKYDFSELLWEGKGVSDVGLLAGLWLIKISQHRKSHSASARILTNDLSSQAPTTANHLNPRHHVRSPPAPPSHPPRRFQEHAYNSEDNGMWTANWTLLGVHHVSSSHRALPIWRSSGPCHHHFSRPVLGDDGELHTQDKPPRRTASEPRRPRQQVQQGKHSH